MPSNNVAISQLNPLDVFDQDRALLPQYNQKYQDAWLFTETLQPWQVPGVRYYAQKWQTNDVIRLQWVANIAPIFAYLVDASGGRRRVFAFAQKQADRTGSGTFVYEVAIDLAGVVEGFYKLIFTIGDPVVKTLETDWLDIRNQHPRTTLLEYSDSDPAALYGDALFATGWAPSFRVEGYFKLKQPYSQDVVYVDQVYNQRLQSSDPYDVETFILGPTTGVPDWVVRKMNWLMGCDTVFYDGKQYSKGDGSQGATSKWEENSADEKYAFRGWTIDLYPAKRRSSRAFDLTAGASQKKILVALNVETQGFADTSTGTSSNVITITKVD